MKRRLCNMTYTDDETGTKRLCQDGNPRPAIYARATAKVCADCWPYVQSKLLEPYKANPAVAMAALMKTFKRIG